MGKIIEVCQFGVTHKMLNCRCQREHTERRHIPCDVPEQHQPKTPILDALFETVEKPEGQTLRNRMAKSVHSTFGSIVSPETRDALLDRLEQDVKDWLLHEMNKII